ncbi:phosphoserine aminotransferase [Gracilaria domingensis]|nr:phosphoserine aminotransferase [Gracilaria domingensis]
MAAPPSCAFAFVPLSSFLPSFAAAHRRRPFTSAARPAPSLNMVITASKPTTKPQSPCFSSGPCKKRPGYQLERALSDAPLGRSHRSKLGKAKLLDAITRTKQILQIPEDYRVAIVPARLAHRRCVASGAGAGEPVHRGRVRLAAGSVRRQQGPRRGVHLQRHHVGRARAGGARLHRRRSQRAEHLRRHVGGVRHARAVEQGGRAHVLVAKGAGRRGGARHAGAVAARRGAAGDVRAAAAAAKDLPHDQEGQAGRGAVPGQRDQHGVHAVRGGLPGRAQVVREHRRAGGADRALAAQPGGAGGLCGAQRVGALPGEGEGAPLEHVGVPDAGPGQGAGQAAGAHAGRRARGVRHQLVPRRAAGAARVVRRHGGGGRPARADALDRVGVRRAVAVNILLRFFDALLRRAPC